MTKDYAALAQEIVISLRGGSSQEQINRKLKFKSNQLARWESGHAKISWLSFCDLAEATKRPLPETLRKYVYYSGKDRDSLDLVRFLTHFHTQKQVAEKLGVSKSVVSRLVAGKSELDLETFLALVDLSPANLVDFIGALTTPNMPASIRFEQERALKEKTLHFENPWAAALILYICATEYTSLPKHSDEFLALKLGVTGADVRKVIKQLVDIQVLELRGKLYYPLNIHLNTTGSFEGAINVRKYWLNQTIQKLEAAKPGNRLFVGYKVFSVHTETLPAFEDLYFRFTAELDKLIAEPKQQPDKVYLFSTIMVDVDHSRGGKKG